MRRGNEILVGVDGSDESDAAVAWAVREASSRRCGVMIVHACESRYYGLWTTTKTLRAGLRQMARPIVDDALAVAARTDRQVPARGGVLVAAPTRALETLSEHVPLTVIGRNGRGALSHLMLGSVTQHLMAHAHSPVVAVGRPPRTVPPGTVDRVVAAITDVDANEHTLRLAIAEAGFRQVPLLVIHAVDPQLPRQPAERQLTSSLAPWQASYPDIDLTGGVLAGSLPATIAEACTPRDLLLIGHHRHPAIAHHALGAKASAALHAAPCPVAVVHETIALEAVPPATAEATQGWNRPAG